jgi:hypothetical protein
MPRVRLDGGVIGVTNNPTGSSATGMWSMKEHEKFTRSSLWPAASPLAGTVNAIALLVAGGGGGGGWSAGVYNGGGGGAGGLYYNSALSLTTLSGNYTITIGAGGAGGAGIQGANGSNSSITGTTNLTVIGGGAGGGSGNGFAGGSGGGGGGPTGTTTAGASIQNSTFGYGLGNAGGAGLGSFAGGGGGGSANAGGTGATTAFGGIGTGYNFANGTLVYYAGGGSGGSSAIAANLGGGGASGNPAGNGTISTGGGGGGAIGSTSGGGNGGSGVTIISYPLPQQFSGGVVTNLNSTNVVHTFTTSGSLNALATPIDTYFPQTTLLLHGDDTGGANNIGTNANNTVFLDSAANTYIPAATGTTFSNYFNGTTDYITTPSANSSLFEMGSGDYTVEFWFYALNNSDGGLVFKGLYQSGATWQPGFGVRRLSATQLRFTFNTSGAAAGEKNYDYTTTTNTNQWYHVAMVVSGGVGYAFVNGTLANPGGLASIGTISASSTPITIGAFPYNVGYIYFNGYISNVRILKGTALYTASFTPPTAPLTAISNTQLLTSQSRRFVDNSTNNLTITQTGNPLISSGGYVITPTGKPHQGTFTPFSQTGWSNYFPGVNTSYLTTPNFAVGSGDFTVEAWTFLTVNQASTIFCNTFRLEITSSTTISVINNGVTNLISSAVVPNLLNRWAHIAVTRSGTNLSLFVDGSLITTVTNSTNFTSATTRIGVESGSLINPFAGYISNLRVVTGTALYTAAFIPSLSPLTAVSGTQLLTCQSNYFKDNSTNAYTLTITGSAAAVQPFSPFSPSSTYSNTTVGGSITLSGSSNYISIPGNTVTTSIGTGPFTIEGWFYPTGIASTTNLWGVDNGSSANPKVINYFNSGSLILDTGNMGASQFPLNVSASLIANGAWNHIAYVRSGTGTNQSYVFINGTLANTGTINSSVNFSSVTQPFNIGYVGEAFGTTFNGHISNFRISNTALYTSSFTLPTSPFTATANTNFLLSATNASIIDSTGKNTLTTYGSAAISSTQSKFGNSCLYFNGTTDYLQIPASPNIPLLGDFTVECWIYPTTINNNNMILGSDNGGSSDYFQFTSTTVQLAVSAASTPNYPTWSHSFTTNQWYHIAVVRQSGTLSCYVNGVVRTLSSGSASETRQLFISNVALQVGRYGYSVSPWYFSGYIDELRITRGYARYTSNFTPPTSAFLDR